MQGATSSQTTISPTSELAERVKRSIAALYESNPTFATAYDTYNEQYGKEVIRVNDPSNLGETVDPVAIILGRNCFVFFHDTEKTLTGSIGRLSLNPGIAYILGRREPQDSKLLAWNPIESTEVELSEYNSSASSIPSRIHCAIMVANETNVHFADLGSTAGTILVGESRKTGPFVRVYDPGSAKFPTIRIDLVNTSRR
jgi:hypothetical protein